MRTHPRTYLPDIEVSVKFGGNEVALTAHQAVLGAASPVFEDAVSAVRPSAVVGALPRIQLRPSVPVEALTLFIEFLYEPKGSVMTIPEHVKVRDVLELAWTYETGVVLKALDGLMESKFQVGRSGSRVEEAVEWMGVVRGFGPTSGGKSIMSASRTAAREWVKSEFQRASLAADWPKVGKHSLRSLFGSDELDVETEDIVVAALVKWIDLDRDGRVKRGVELAKLIRWNYVSPGLLQTVLTNALIVAPKDEGWMEVLLLVTSGFRYQASGVSLSPQKPRLSYAQSHFVCNDCAFPRQPPVGVSGPIRDDLIATTRPPVPRAPSNSVSPQSLDRGKGPGGLVDR